MKAMQKRLYFVGIFVLSLWLVFIVDCIVPQDIHEWGIIPRTIGGLVGIPLSPFLHASLTHLLGNTISLAILLSLLVGTHSRPWLVVGAIALLGGALLWLMGTSNNHIGASGIAFGLIAYMLVTGFVERKPKSIAIALAVAFFFGGTLISGVIPKLGSNVSWDGHLFGAIAGAGVAYFLHEKNKRMSW